MTFRLSNLSPGKATCAAMLVVLTSVLTPSLVGAQSASPERGQTRRGPGGPPPQEAYDACASLAVGDSCAIETPENTLSGSCQLDPRDQQTLCVPVR